MNTSEASFKIVTENVICSTTGATCSRAITITIGVRIVNLHIIFYISMLVMLHAEKNRTELCFKTY